MVMMQEFSKSSLIFSPEPQDTHCPSFIIAWAIASCPTDISLPLIGICSLKKIRNPETPVLYDSYRFLLVNKNFLKCHPQKPHQEDPCIVSFYQYFIQSLAKGLIVFIHEILSLTLFNDGSKYSATMKYLDPFRLEHYTLCNFKMIGTVRS
jgi:hypothetical protein